MHYPGMIFTACTILACVFCGQVMAYPDQAVIAFQQGNAILGNISTLNPNTTDEQLALSAFNLSTTIAPDFYEAWNGKADALNRLGYYNEALEASNRSLAVNSSYVPAWINRGEILYMLGYQAEQGARGQQAAEFYYNEQIGAFRKATELDPGNAAAWFNLGFALAGENKYDEALNAFDTVRSINPAYPHLDYYVQLARNNRDAAMPFYIRYAPWILGVVVLAGAGGAVLWSRRSSSAEPEEGANRKTRRRKKQKFQE